MVPSLLSQLQLPSHFPCLAWFQGLEHWEWRLGWRIWEWVIRAVGTRKLSSAHRPLPFLLWLPGATKGFAERALSESFPHNQTLMSNSLICILPFQLSKDSLVRPRRIQDLPCPDWLVCLSLVKGSALTKEGPNWEACSEDQCVPHPPQHIL